MVEQICDKLMKRVKLKMPEVDDQRAEVIRYGFELIIGEVPKFFILLAIAWLCGLLEHTIISIIVISTYRFTSGGVHLKSHIGCMIGTTFMYMGTAIISKAIYFPNFYIKIVVICLIYIFSIIMITLYAPADTDYVPILRKRDRKIKKIASYIIVTLILLGSIIIKNRIISNICIIGVLFQSITITRLVYKMFNVKFGYLEYIKTDKNAV